MIQETTKDNSNSVADISEDQLLMQIEQAHRRISRMKKEASNAKRQVNQLKILSDAVYQKKSSIAIQNAHQQNQYKMFLEKQKQTIQILKHRNIQAKKQSKRDISDIMLAIYMVKHDDAKELRKISAEHQQKLRAMSESNIERKVRNYERAKSRQGLSQKEYWRNKLSALHSSRKYQQMIQKQRRDQKQKQLDQLIENQNAKDQALRQKKKYISQKNMPIKKIIDKEFAYISITANPIRRGSHENESQLAQQDRQRQKQMKFSREERGQQKLKIILERLKKRE